MALYNQMTKLLNQIERRLGTKSLNLPDSIGKNSWAEIIIEDTLSTFSEYYPHKMLWTLQCKDHLRDIDGYYRIDETELGADVEVLGVRDISWSHFSDSIGQYSASQFGEFGSACYADIGNTFSVDDMFMGQMRADQMSFMNNGIFIDFEYPNRFKLTSCTGQILTQHMQKIPVYLLVKHAENLSTISPTMNKTFSKLAQADVALFLYNELKHFSNLETVYGRVDISIDDFKMEADKRDEIIQEIKDSYVAVDNHNMPMIMTV